MRRSTGDSRQYLRKTALELVGFSPCRGLGVSSAQITGMRQLVFKLFVLAVASAHAQSVSLLNQGLNDAVRRAQLWGSVPATSSSFCVRPVNAVRALGFTDPYGFDAKYDFTKPGDDTINALAPQLTYKDLAFVRAVPVITRVQFNSHHDYGWQDGPMIPNKGLQMYASAGVYGRLYKGLIEFQYAPEVVYAQNQDLPAPGVRRWRGDLPDRFGTEAYRRSSGGQSYIKLNVDFLTVGLSSANVAWGPGRFSTIMLSENAPGMNHFSVESNKPLKTKWGTLEGQFLTGKLKHSGFLYSTGPTGDGSSLEPVFAVPGLDTTFRVWTGAVGVFSPTILPGFSLGVTRVVFTDGPVTNPNYSDYIALFFSNPFRGGGGGTQVGVNQMAGAFVRYVMPESHVEFYGEYGFDDNRYDLEDLIVSPDHSRGYMWGVRKLQPVNGTKEYWDFTYEMGQYEGAKEMLNRTQFGYAVFYDGSPSNSGQYLGAGIGSGSNQWILNLDKVKENKRIGFTYERIARNNDALYERRVPWVGTWYGFDFTKKYVESSLGVNYSERRGPVLFWAKALLTQTYNWNHWYDPAGTASPMRANGYNLKSVNVFTGATILL
jgi:hypothetical protein